MFTAVPIILTLARFTLPPSNDALLTRVVLPIGVVQIERLLPFAETVCASVVVIRICAMPPTGAETPS